LVWGIALHHALISGARGDFAGECFLKNGILQHGCILYCSYFLIESDFPGVTGEPLIPPMNIQETSDFP